MDERICPNGQLPLSARHERAEAQLQPDGAQGEGEQEEACRHRSRVLFGKQLSSVTFHVSPNNFA